MREDMAIRRQESGIPFAEITGKEVERTLGRNLQERAINWMRANLQGKTFRNDSTGWDISVGRKGINKAMSHGAKDSHARSVPAIPSLLKNAVLVASEQNKSAKDRMDIAAVHHFYAPFVIGGEKFIARMVVKETRSGQKFYDYDTSDVISPAEQAADAHLPKEGAAARSAGRTMSMSELLSYVKAEHGGTDPKFAADGRVRNGEQEGLPDTLMVDGISRPTLNSNGQPIHYTAEGIRNFWRWMNGTNEQRLGRLEQEAGEGADRRGLHQPSQRNASDGLRRLFDDAGRPRSFYHGTAASFNAFDLDHPGRLDQGWLGRGVYLSDDPELANSYSNIKEMKQGGEPNVMPLTAFLHLAFSMILMRRLLRFMK